VSNPVQAIEPADPRRRIHSLVALSLLEALRDQDLPEEVLDDENLTLTLPRRLGLSGVVDSQIRRYREDARRRRRVPDREIHDLVRLVVRRPDSREVFLRVGRDLHGSTGTPGWRRFLPRRAALALARRRILQRLRTLFGRPLVEPSPSSFAFQALDDVFISGDPGGDACEIVTGFLRTELGLAGLEAERLSHVSCRAYGADACIWELVEDAARAGGNGVG
jgi:hypothetical protein